MRCTSIALTLGAIATMAAAAPRMSKRVGNGDILGDGPADTANCPDDGPADTCRYEATSQGDDVRLDHIVGDPVGNCQGGDSDITSTVGGDSTVSQTWKEGVSEGFDADGGEEFPVGISISNSDSWSSTEAHTFRQNIDITISPGKKAALIAKVLHHTYIGRMVINYGDTVGPDGDEHYEWYANGLGSVQPTDDVIYDQRIVNCDEDI